MTQFVASNREVVCMDDRGFVRVAGIFVGPAKIQALREFFQAERDAELGRWRWPENPDYVVYPNENHSVSVIDESTGVREETLTRDETNHDISEIRNVFFRAAKAYFDAHPERKPWHDAKPGEVWVITYAVNSEQSAFWVNPEGVFASPNGATYPIDSPWFSNGRRIWPEPDGD